MLTRQLAISKRYLNLPIENAAPKRAMTFLVNGKNVRDLFVHLAEGEPDYWVFANVKRFIGQSLTIEAETRYIAADALDAITQSDTPHGLENLYNEQYRPQFHFSTQRGWINDPDGLVYYKGQYHLFYQHNPYGWTWEPTMYWGHAVSTDLVHWKELETALEPDELGPIWSGTAVVDWNNTAGLQTGDEKTLVALYTSAGGNLPASKDQRYTQSLAYSNDSGKTWTKYEHNPVIPYEGQQWWDPKVFWHEPTGQWVMALYLDAQKDQSAEHYGLFRSPDLKQWELMSKLTIAPPRGKAYPDMFELPIDGDPSNTRWVFWLPTGLYMVGTFDGRTLTPESELIQFQRGAFADLVWNDIPPDDGRVIQIGWLRSGDTNTGEPGHRGMPFNQQMSFPRVLTLHSTSDGLRVFAKPVREIEKLHGKRNAWQDIDLSPDGENPLADIEGELFDIRVEFELQDASEFGINVRGMPVRYDVGRQELCFRHPVAPLPPEDGKIRLQLLIDRSSIEVFGNNGQVAYPFGFLPEADDRSLTLYTKAGNTRVKLLEVYELHSIWL